MRGGIAMFHCMMTEELTIDINWIPVFVSDSDWTVTPLSIKTELIPGLFEKKSTNICCFYCLSADGLWKSICHEHTHSHTRNARVGMSAGSQSSLSSMAITRMSCISLGSGWILPTESIDREMIKLQVFKAHDGILQWKRFAVLSFFCSVIHSI